MVDNDIHTRDRFLDGPLDPTRDGELVVNLFSQALPVKNRKEGFVSGCHLYVSWGSVPHTTPAAKTLPRSLGLAVLHYS